MENTQLTDAELLEKIARLHSEKGQDYYTALKEADKRGLDVYLYLNDKNAYDQVIQRDNNIEYQQLLASTKSVALERRFLNYFLDMMVIIPLYWLLRTYGLLGFEFEIFDFDFRGFNILTWRLETAVFVFLYYFIMESIWQQSIGKMITRTYVLKDDGSKPSVGRIAWRSFCRLIPFDAISFVIFKEGIHDSWSSTMVKDK